jgi:hypothetical protein
MNELFFSYWYSINQTKPKKTGVEKKQAKKGK